MRNDAERSGHVAKVNNSGSAAQVLGTHARELVVLNELAQESREQAFWKQSRSFKCSDRGGRVSASGVQGKRKEGHALVIGGAGCRIAWEPRLELAAQRVGEVGDGVAGQVKRQD